MKFLIFLFILPGFLFIGLTSCDFLNSYERGNGHEVTVTRNMEPFSQVSMDGNFEVTLKKSDQEIITITTDENLEPLIHTKVDNGDLVISSGKKLISSHKIKIEVSYRILNDIKIFGAGLVKNDEVLEGENLKLDLEGAGVIDLRLKVSDLDARLSGAGVVKFNGYATRANINLSGAGGLDAYGLETNDCHIVVSGLGGAKVNVTGDLTASIEGLGGIKYIGHPANVHKNVSGIGEIKEDEDSVENKQI